MRKKWFKKRRFKLYFYGKFLCIIPQPKWLKRWYYKKSFEWWGHPSNHHWKMKLLDCHCKLEGEERCIWCGGYNTGQNETVPSVTMEVI